MKRILIDGGYIEGGVYYFYLTDHLGNNRVVTSSSGAVIQKTHYYPFGMAFAESTDQGKQPYKYNGKEFDQMHGLNLYDYSARYMEPALGRFTTLDPLVDKYYSVSPYVYCNNNPLSLTDPTGMSPEDEKAGQSIFGSIAQSIKSLFSISIDATSSKTIQESKQQIEANGQLIEQSTKNVNTASDALSLIIPFSSVVDVVANSAAGNKDAALAALPLVVLDIATVGKGKAVKGGASEMIVYRVFVGDARVHGFSWTTVNPTSVKDFRNLAGLPSGRASGAINTADFMIKGKVNINSIIKSRSALPLDGNIGGLPELIIDPKNVRLIDFKALKP